MIRVDGGRVWGISTGHITRELIVAKALSKWYKIIFVMKNYPDGVRLVKNAGFRVKTLDPKDDTDASLIALCKKFNPQKVIFDLYANPYRNFFNFARRHTIKTIVFDVINGCSGVPDVLINDSFVKKFTTYNRLIGSTKLFLGPDYFLLNKPPRVALIRKHVHTVMLTMGGSDPAGLTLKILRVLIETRACADCSLTVVLGPLYQGTKDVYELIGNQKYIRILQAPSNFLEILRKQDIVITACGRTLYECAYLGRPAILVPSIKHESIIAGIYAQKTGCINIGLWNKKKSPLKLVKSLAAYKARLDLRRSIHAAGRAFIDGKGQERILELIHNTNKC
ncbi:MAG TPA: hypothetical protein PKL77_07700 [Candidatus Omnitrophota bacterium]|nr:hypothetical protein [Candidatus Omnitrophota bacterium]